MSEVQVDWSRPVQHRGGGRCTVLEIYPDDHAWYPGQVCIRRDDEPCGLAQVWIVPQNGEVGRGLCPDGRLDIVNVSEPPQ